VPDATITIISRNYGSWSLRGWLLCRFAGLDVEAVESPVEADEIAQAAAQYRLAIESVVCTATRRYPLSSDSLPARYARAIATYRHGDLRSAIAQIDSLIQLQPANPYFYELRGQALLEGGKPAEAIVPLRKAVQLSNNAPLIEMLLGQALVATNNNAHTEEAIAILRAAVARETEAPIGYTQLAMAYGRKGDLAQADLASAQAAFLRGDNKTARDLASRAKTRFAVGTPGWVKADDIVSAKPLPGQKDN